jgi:Endosomal/lysosomal potassium channel TMEM175
MMPLKVDPMIRELAGHQLVPPEKDSRWLDGDITRLEAFSDAVFAFAVTLLVVSLEVPHTFDELMVAMKGFVAFAICFATAPVMHSSYKKLNPELARAHLIVKPVEVCAASIECTYAPWGIPRSKCDFPTISPVSFQ